MAFACLILASVSTEDCASAPWPLKAAMPSIANRMRFMDSPGVRLFDVDDAGARISGACTASSVRAAASIGTMVTVAPDGRSTADQQLAGSRGRCFAVPFALEVRGSSSDSNTSEFHEGSPAIHA